MVHVRKLSGPQRSPVTARDCDLPSFLPQGKGVARVYFFYRGIAMAEFQHVNCMIERI